MYANSEATDQTLRSAAADLALHRSPISYQMDVGRMAPIIKARIVLANKQTLYLTETPFNAFANRTAPDQAALVRSA